MSRRKQSNPKPLKRKTEDNLEEVAEALHLPSDIFVLREPEDEAFEFTVFTKVTVQEGTIFGPYSCHLLKEDEDESPSNVLEAKDFTGLSVRLGLRDNSGGWLKLLRPSPDTESTNVIVSLGGNEVWCCLASTVEADSELLAHYKVLESASKSQRTKSSSYSEEEIPPNSKLHFDPQSSKLLKIKSEDGPSSTKREETSVVDRDHASILKLGDAEENYRHSPPTEDNGQIVLYNGSSSCDVKYEVISPKTGSPGSPEGYRGDTGAYMNGYNVSGLPYGFNSGACPDGIYQCQLCEARFSSRGTLQAHQLFYCRHKLQRNPIPPVITSDTDSEEALSPAKSGPSRNARTTETSPPPDDVDPGRLFHRLKRHLETSAGEQSSAKLSRLTPHPDEIRTGSGDSRFSRTSRIYKCHQCHYVTDKKAVLTRHERMHSLSPMPPDLIPSDLHVTTSPLARYCANCDIQFASFKNYQVHKQFYCNTRHVHKSMPSSPTHQQPNHPPMQSSSPEKLVPSVPIDAKSRPYNMVLNQPLYAAISTSPLILVPCSYVAGGGLSPAAGLIPAGNIIIPGSSSMQGTENATTPQGPSVIPTYTVMPGGSSTMPPGDGSRDATSSPAASHLEADGKDIVKSKRHPSKEKTDISAKDRRSESVASSSISTDTSPAKSKDPTSETEKPLDLSFKKRDSEKGAFEALVRTSNRRTPETGNSSLSVLSSSSSSSSSSSNSSSNSVEDSSALVPLAPGASLPFMPVLNPSLDIASGPSFPSTGAPLVDVSNAIGTLTAASSQVVVKQGTSKCKECNIVFYKHENYLVHKNLYCASRLQKNHAEPSAADVRVSVEEDNNTKPEPGRVSASPLSPRVTSSKSPLDPSDASGRQSQSSPVQNAVFQFYCMACGIKFTSLDNLTAHQTYYCPKRELVGNQAIGVAPALRNQEYKCSKCKNAYPNEETLKTHPCVVQRKCPYCDVFCPTLSAAQRHLVTHTGVKSFRCSLCGYKGHTLRGMRTHIRIHLDKNNTTPEENYILCVDEGGSEVGCASRKVSSRPSTERASSVVGALNPQKEKMSVPIPTGTLLSSDTTSRISIIENLSDTMATSDITHWCQICGYSSSYKGNVVRHVKLVHKDIMSAQNMSSIVLSRPNTASTETLVAKPSADHAETSNQSSDVSVSVEHSDDSSNKESKHCSLINGTSSSVSSDNDPVHNRSDDSSMKSQTLSPGSTTKGANRIPQRDASSPVSSNSLPNSKVGPKYCKACDISFNYLSNFIAHKKFYCTPKPGDGSGQEATSVQ